MSHSHSGGGAMRKSKGHVGKTREDRPERKVKQTLEHGLYFPEVPSKVEERDVVAALREQFADLNIHTSKLIEGDRKKVMTVLAYPAQVVSEIIGKKFVSVNGCSIYVKEMQTTHGKMIEENQRLGMRAVPESVEVEVARSVTMAPNERRTLTVRIVNQWTFDVVLVAIVPEKAADAAGSIDVPRIPHHPIAKAGGFLSLNLSLRSTSALGFHRWSLKVCFKSMRARVLPLTVRVCDPHSPSLRAALYEEPSAQVVDEKTRYSQRAFYDRRLPAHLSAEEHSRWKKPLPQYPVPEAIQRDVMNVDKYWRIKGWKTRDNYKQRLQELLFVEEAACHKEERQHDVRGVRLEGPLHHYMIRGRQYRHDDSFPIVRMPIEDVSERVPGLQPNDKLYAWVVRGEESADVESEGVVAHVEANSVLVYFHHEFHRTYNLKTSVFNVRFCPSRVPYREMHFAVQEVDIDVVWPLRLHGQHVTVTEEMRRSLKHTKLNEGQMAAMAHIIHGQKGSPIVLEGAFGTGKTHTLVRAVATLLDRYPESKILMCGESDVTADHFLSSLVDVGNVSPKHVLRQYSMRFGGAVPSKLRPFVPRPNQNGSVVFEWPPLAQLEQYRLIVCTADVALSLYGIGLRRGHFSHVIVDGAAHMMEMKALMPLTLVCPRETTVVLCGDTKQIGPFLRSQNVRNHGMQLSILERESLHAHRYELVMNYRNHPAIIDLPSRWFYESKLKSDVKPFACEWKVLPNRHYPILFVGVTGSTRKDAQCPSYYNMEEVDTAVRYCSSLLSTIGQRDIALLAPYRMQVQKLREAVRALNMRHVDVGPLHSMLQRQKRAVIVSLTQSRNRQSDAQDERFGLGFVGEPRKLNTAITRTLEVLVVIGDPSTVSEDPQFRDLIASCKENKSFVAPEQPLSLPSPTRVEDDEEEAEEATGVSSLPLESPTLATIVQGSRHTSHSAAGSSADAVAAAAAISSADAVLSSNGPLSAFEFESGLSSMSGQLYEETYVNRLMAGAGGSPSSEPVAAARSNPGRDAAVPSFSMSGSSSADAPNQSSDFSGSAPYSSPPDGSRSPLFTGSSPRTSSNGVTDTTSRGAGGGGSGGGGGVGGGGGEYYGRGPGTSPPASFTSGPIPSFGGRGTSADRTYGTALYARGAPGGAPAKSAASVVGGGVFSRGTGALGGANPWQAPPSSGSGGGSSLEGDPFSPRGLHSNAPSDTFLSPRSSGMQGQSGAPSSSPLFHTSDWRPVYSDENIEVQQQAQHLIPVMVKRTQTPSVVVVLSCIGMQVAVSRQGPTFQIHLSPEVHAERGIRTSDYSCCVSIEVHNGAFDEAAVTTCPDHASLRVEIPLHGTVQPVVVGHDRRDREKVHVHGDM